MKLERFSEKQIRGLGWWCSSSPYQDKQGVIFDGGIRSGKTICMGLSFVLWAFCFFDNESFALCGKTIKSIKRNLVLELLPLLHGFHAELKSTENKLVLSAAGIKNEFYLFGGKDASSAALIQGMTLAGVLFDEAALMPRSFVEQALARCSVEGAKFWFNCNPENPAHWFYREWIEKKAEKNMLYLHFTMEDNPSLSESTKKRYRDLFSGVFYERFVEGKWTVSEGLVYPFAADICCDKPAGEFAEYAVSCDYGTVNPASFGLWGRQGSTWYRIEEYYYAAKETGVQRTDEEHYRALEILCADRDIVRIVVDPSAASFITLIKKAGRYAVLPAQNRVADGIRQVSSALKEGRIKICKNCRDTIKEFGLYKWSGDRTRDVPVKEHDHAMDDIRYFVSTLLPEYGESPAFAVAVKRDS